MWTYIKKEYFDYFIERYQFQDYIDEIILFETKDAYFLPRLFAENFPGNHLEVFNKKEELNPSQIDGMDFTGKLRDEQVPIVKKILDIYNKNGHVNGIIKARPGLGKTVLSVYLAKELGMKTLIVVDNQNLMKQWIKAFLEFTNLTEQHIGVIQQKHFNIDRPIIIAMAQTLLSKLKSNMQTAFQSIDKGRIGVVIYDEVHATSSAPVFAKISLLFRTRNIIGLSATPFQTGAAEILMKNTVGDIVYETNQYDLTPEYRLLYYKSDLSKKYINVLTHITDYLTRKSIYNKAIIGSEKYLNLIINETKKALANKHKIIILCFTKNQVNTISDRLTDIGIENKKFYGEERTIEYNEDILVATYSFAGKGFDYKDLSCLILACPLAGKKSLIQVIGRILRSNEGKQKPLVIDLADMTVPTFTIPEIKMKKKIVSNEFHCKIIEQIIEV